MLWFTWEGSFDIDRILEIEQQPRHDVVAFTRAVSERLVKSVSRVHYGLTSTDVVDYGPMVASTNKPTWLIRKDLENFLQYHRWQSEEHKFSICGGRTWCARWADWLSVSKIRPDLKWPSGDEHAAAGVEAGKDFWCGW